MSWLSRYKIILAWLKNNTFIKSVMKITIHIIVIIILALALFSIVLGNQWQQISGFGFIIYFQNDDLTNSEKILNALQPSYLRISKELETQLTDSITIFLAPSREIFQQMVGNHIPKWSNGIATPVNNTIILKSPKWAPPETDNTMIVVHELTHLILARAAKGKPIPGWLNEGLAIYYSREKGFASSSAVSKALVTKSIIPLNEIDDVLQFHTEKAQLAYQESYLAIDYLFRVYGSDAVKKIIHQIGEGSDVDQAFLETINIDSWEFEAEWLEQIQQKYRWHFLVEFGDYLWILILALFVFGFIIMRRRNKRTIQQWQEEDEIQKPW